MVIPDVNLLVYAYCPESTWHEKARHWWQGLLNSQTPVGLALVVRLGFIRLMGSPALVDPPVEPARSLQTTSDWLKRPNVQEIWPTSRHDELLASLLERSGVPGRVINDAHLAALCLERNAELHTNDHNLRRFPGLKVVNPLQ